jgi:diguanylate cyclase (GGDEF)-like protein
MAAVEAPPVEMPAVRSRPAPRRPAQHPPIADVAFDEITEIVPSRATDFGEPPPVPVARDCALLLRMDGVEAGRSHSLTEEPCRIGRHVSSELRVDDTGISRCHARIVYEGAGHVIEDLGSRNGTYVQGQAVMRRRLVDGDWIQLGPRVAFRFSLVDATQQALLEQLYDSSTRDSLTGVYNRKHFDERLRAEVAYCLRHRSDASLVLFDIDHFKGINDRWGHPAGDAVLRQVARLAAQRLRAEDVFARIGGEEFAVVLRGIDLAGAGRVGERLRATVAAVPVVAAAHPVPVTISVGCAALSCCREASAAALFAGADARLYAAKRTGRNRVVAC